ncbi:MAG: hypothetical protein KF845_00455 [Cyclobacteriaceae bacterium]|nr:hypothetical protein [Cyclobacteriaceae bacterium]
MKKKILYVDMDNVLVDFQSGIDRLDSRLLIEYEGRLDEVPGIFSLMLPVKDAVESYHELCEHFDTYILSTSPWKNESAPGDKLAWVKKYIGEKGYKRLILTHHKNLNMGNYLVDDRKNNGASEFTGEWIHFKTPKFPDWITVKKYLLDNK